MALPVSKTKVFATNVAALQKSIVESVKVMIEKNHGKRTNIGYGGFLKQWYPKMDSENNGKAYEQMDDLGGKPHYLGNTRITSYYIGKVFCTGIF